MAPKSKAAIIFLSLFLPAALFMTGSVAAEQARLDTPWIGVYTQSIDEDLQDAFDLGRSDGVVIVDVMKDSPAGEAGLRRKDIIITFNGRAVSESTDLIDAVREASIGDKVEVVYVRRDKERTATVQIGSRSRDIEEDHEFWVEKIGPGTQTYHFSSHPTGYIGVGIQNLTDQLGEFFGIEDGEGVLVTEVFEDSPAEAAGLKAGDIIVAVDGEDVARTDELSDIISTKEEGDNVSIEFIRNKATKTVTVTVAEDVTGRSSISRMPNTSLQFPNIGNLRYRFYGDDDAGNRSGELQEEIDELRDELKALRREIKDLQDKLK